MQELPKTTKSPAVLDRSQLRALAAFERGRSVAILGSAGSGKSYLLSLIVDMAKRKHGNGPAVAVCAMTNQAAMKLGGCTIHSLFGAPPSWEFSKEGLWTLVQRSPNRMERLREVQVVVIDEGATIQAGVFDAFDYVMRHLAFSERHSTIPFGGRQVVIAGDPFQLEPVGMTKGKDESYHSFSSRSWFLMFGGFGSGVVSILSGNHRQRGDESFFSVLNRIRLGTATIEDINRLNETSSGEEKPPESHTVLCLKRNQVDSVNSEALSDIEGTLFNFQAEDTYVREQTEDLTSRICQTAQKTVQVKVGCHLLLTRKVDEFPPGTRTVVENVQMGTVKPRSISVRVLVDGKCCKRLQLSPVKFHVHDTDTSVLAYRLQLPVISAYAVTVHRSQGLSLRSVAMDFSVVCNWRPSGMVYVALSRCTSLKGLWVRGLSLHHIKVSKDAYRLMNKLALLKKAFPTRFTGSAGISESSGPSVCAKRPNSLIQDVRTNNICVRNLRRRVL